MLHRISKTLLAVLIVAVSSSMVWAGVPQDETLYMGKPFSYWLKVIQDRDPEKIEFAFDAMVEFGPEAWEAVPDLTRIVTEPFTPIHLGEDSPEDIIEKVWKIQLRGGAIDSLGAIGDAAAPSAEPLIEWAFAIRVVPAQVKSPEIDRLFVDLVAIDVLEKMRIAGAVSQLGPGAAPAIQELLESPDFERRKFSVAILNAGVLPIAARLLKSEDCERRSLGASLMANMWPVIAVEHLSALKDIAKCGRTPSKTDSIGKQGRLVR
jgi:hypothetical protein